MDEATPLIAANPLETALVAARKGEIPIQEFLRKLLESDVAVPTASEVQTDGSGFVPLVLDKEGTGMVAVFTSLDRATHVQAHAQYALTINARSFLRALSRDVGVVLNPGFTEGIDITPQGIQDILAAFAAEP